MKKAVLTLLSLFIASAVCIYLLSGKPAGSGREIYFMHGANVLLFALGLATLQIQAKSLSSSNPNSFVRAVMGSMIIKMFVIMGALTVFLITSGGVGKLPVFASAGMYFIYLVTEVSIILGMNRRKNG